MKKTVLCITFTLFLVLMCRSVFAMPANPAPFEVSQPDGKTVWIYIRGDERFHWYEDTDGYTVVCDNGRYAYGQLDKDNRLIATPLTVGVDNPKAAGLKKKTLPPVSVRRSMNPSFLSGSSESSTSPAMVPPLGTVKNLVVLCKFSDHTLGVHTRVPGDYDILFNQVGGDPTLAPTGSVKDLYIENSYNAMTLQSTVTVWVTLPNTEAYYANGEDGVGTYSYPQNAQKMVEDALNLVDPLVDFSQFDNDLDGYIDAIDIIHSGYGAETGGGGGNWIWSHRWSLWALPGGQWTSNDKNINNINIKVYDYHTEPALWGTSGTNIVRFGVIAHETGHFFGLPDLYDTDGSGAGVGSWCMMANSWGFDSTQLHPPHFSAWSKIQLGWVTPTVISVPESYAIGQAETNPQVYRINYGYPSDEYLLIENRQPVGIESTMPQGGLCIYHIDDLAGYNTEGYPGQAGWPANGNHYRVALLQADGNYNLEKDDNRGDRYDVYHAAGVSQIGTGPGNYPNTDAYQSGNIIVTYNTLNSISAAGASMSFVYDNGSVPHPPVAIDVNTSTPLNTPVTITLSATDEGLPNPPGDLSYIITSLPSHGTLNDPNAGSITAVPYTVAGNGNQVVYTPTTGYSGPDNFTFKANDGGVPPDGGDSNIATVSITVNPKRSTIFSEDFESGLGSFTIDNTFGDGSGLWHLTTTCNSTLSGHSTPTSLYYGQNGTCNYDAGQTEGIVTSSVISLAGASVILLEFNYMLETEQFSGFDVASIEVSENGGDFIEYLSNTAGTLQDSSGGWVPKTLDLSSMAGSNVQIRFRFRTVDDLYNTYPGFYVDDVNVTGIVPTAQYAISGYVLEQDGNTPVEGVLIQTDDNDVNTVTDANGFYELWVDYGWSGNVVPSKYAYVFEPNSRYYADVNEGATGQDYTGTLLTYRIIGYIKNECNVPIEGVAVSADNGGGQGTTDVNGLYEVWVDYNWSGTVTPTKQNYTFEPNQTSYVNVLADQFDQNSIASNVYDLDCDGSIGFGDVAIISGNWLQTGEDIPGDFYKDDDNTVNFLDFAKFAESWNQ